MSVDGFTLAPVVARLGFAPLRTVQTARLLQAAVPVSATFAVPFCSRPDPAEDDVFRSSVPPLLHDAHPFSSGISFPDWAELVDQPCMWPVRETYDPLMVRRPQGWLLREGWKVSQCGSISVFEVPGRGTS
jgi:hypothetical protein